MSMLVDFEIRRLCQEKAMITPFCEETSGDGVISYGLDHAGYCIRLATTAWVSKNTHNLVVDPKRFRDETYRRRLFDEVEVSPHDPIVIPPNGFILGSSFEYFRIPRNVKGHCIGKSTYARCGIIPYMTPLEPGWEGTLTIEIGNASPCPAYVYTMEGICQIEFVELAMTPEVTYDQKRGGGKYQGQRGITPAIVQ